MSVFISMFWFDALQKVKENCMLLMLPIVAGQKIPKKIGVEGNKHNGAAIENSEQNMGENKQ